MRRLRAAGVGLVASCLALVAATTFTFVTGDVPAPMITPDLGARDTVTAAPPPGSAVTAREARRQLSTVGVPTRISIRSLDVSAEVDATGVSRAGSVEIPADISRVGWYRLGPAPGSSGGSAVIVGHRDGREQGRGAFYGLPNLNLRDRIIVTTSMGRKIAYTVIARETIPKKELPVAELFTSDGTPRLTLISCAGYYSKERGGYQSNIVITAVPVKSRQRTMDAIVRTPRPDPTPAESQLSTRSRPRS